MSRVYNQQIQGTLLETVLDWNATCSQQTAENPAKYTNHRLADISRQGSGGPSGVKGEGVRLELFIPIVVGVVGVLNPNSLVFAAKGLEKEE